LARVRHRARIIARHGNDEVISTSGIRDQFKLAIVADALSRACRITARADNRIEVAFT
jgi:hypothetical protein